MRNVVSRTSEYSSHVSARTERCNLRGQGGRCEGGRNRRAGRASVRLLAASGARTAQHGHARSTSNQERPTGECAGAYAQARAAGRRAAPRSAPLVLLHAVQPRAVDGAQCQRYVLPACAPGGRVGQAGARGRARGVGWSPSTSRAARGGASRGGLRPCRSWFVRCFRRRLRGGRRACWGIRVTRGRVAAHRYMCHRMSRSNISLARERAGQGINSCEERWPAGSSSSAARRASSRARPKTLLQPARSARTIPETPILAGSLLSKDRRAGDPCGLLLTAGPP